MTYLELSVSGLRPRLKPRSLGRREALVPVFGYDSRVDFAVLSRIPLKFELVVNPRGLHHVIDVRLCRNSSVGFELLPVGHEALNINRLAYVQRTMSKSTGKKGRSDPPTLHSNMEYIRPPRSA